MDLMGTTYAFSDAWPYIVELRMNSSKNLSKSSSVLMRCGTSKNLALFWLEW
jgi:hypothetical protein